VKSILRKFRGYVTAAAVIFVLTSAGCGGGGGGGGTTTNPVQPPVQTGDFFISVSNPLYDGQIYNQNGLTVTGRTATDAQVFVNGVSVAVDSAGNFSRSGIAISSNPTSITVDSWRGTTLHYQIIRNVYYDNKSACKVIFIGDDVRSGAKRVFSADPAIPNSARVVYDDLPGIQQTTAALSPDSTHIAFVRDDGVTRSIYNTTCSGGDAVQVASAAGVNFRSLSWSGDGSKLAFASDAPGQYDVYTAPTTGGTATRITTHASRDDYPAWTGGGNELMFVSYRAASGGAGTAGYASLWKVTANPVGTPVLAFDPEAAGLSDCPSGGNACSVRSIDVSAANKVVFQFDRPCGGATQGQNPPSGICSNIFLMNTLTSAPSAVTTGANYYLSPRWNATGDSVVFTDTANGASAIRKFSVQGSTPGASTSLGVSGSLPDH